MENLIQKAIEKGLCPEWAQNFKFDPSIANLCRKFFLGSDWALERNFPELVYLRRYKGQTEQYGIFTDYHGSTPLCRSAFFGNSRVKVTADNFEVKQIIIRHNSTLDISAKGHSITEITVLDNAVVNIATTENAQVNVFYYGAESNIRLSGNVKLFKSSFKTAK